VTAVATHSKAAGVQLYLDLPLGVHPDGYDVWRERNAFCLGAAAGAPPDLFFTKGQNWGFPPLHPEAIRTQGYRYVIAYLRHQLQYAGLLRIDHVMGLHRLFCIPQGIEAKDGVYIRYAADELYAIVNLESHRQQTGIIGENLGTVPSYVNRKMARHHLHRMYVLQYALGPDQQQPLQPVPAETVASLNTHDMPTFAAFWDGLDITDRQDLGLLDQTGADEEQRQRETLKAALKQYLESLGWLQDLTGDGSDVYAACLRYLAASPAQTVLVNLEDIWGETNPQNVPGTAAERPNWRRKSRFGFEQFRDLPLVLDRLQELHHLRQPLQES
jgi:4-alpha-glucanotransferase